MEPSTFGLEPNNALYTYTFLHYCIFYDRYSIFHKDNKTTHLLHYEWLV
jgi:hypothetical protein